MLVWLKASATIFGMAIPHWGILLFIVGAAAEFALGRSKNPKYRSLAGSVFSLLKKLCQFLHVDSLPIVSQILDFVSPPKTTFCPTCKGTGIAPEPEKPTVNGG